MIKKASSALVAATMSVALMGCNTPREGTELQAKITEAQEGDFGACLENVYDSAVAVAEAREILNDAKTDGVSDSRYQTGLSRADQAIATRDAAEEACNVEVVALQQSLQILRGVTFEVNSAVLTPQAKTNLDVAANEILRQPRRLEVAGHTSNTGTPEGNMELSQKRADAVRDYLISGGVNADLITARGYGQTQPIESNDTAEGRIANKRVELIFAE